MSKSLSIIVPVLNEEALIKPLIEHLLNLENSDQSEIIIVDGGSNDASVKIANVFPVKVIESDKSGRAVQMNIGAKHTSTANLFFLHVDSILPYHAINSIKDTLTKDFGAGSFRLGFSGNKKILQIYAWFTRFDIDLFRFGDQGLFIKKDLFLEIGGFDEELFLMEDQEIIKRIKRHSNFSVLSEQIFTSPRKYEKTGVLKTQIIFTIILLLYYLGVNQEVLKHLHQSYFKQK